MSGVTFENVAKSYGDIDAVEHFDVQIEEGEFVSLLGPSGSGKSTLLRMVAGLEDITSGTIRIGDRIVNDIPARDRGIAMVFQNYALYPHMSVRDNMSYGLKLTTDLADDEIVERVRETAELLDISELLDKQPSNISGGQQQRVATGRAIVRDPDVFLMDEPLSNLDAKLKLHMRTELQRLHDELGSTTVYVTHDQEEAMTMSDRIVILADGEIQQVGTSKEIYEEPANMFVADFIGSPSMNFFDVRLEDDSLVSSEFTYPLPSRLADSIREHATEGLVMGIRPENINIVNPDEDGAISAQVDVLEPAGSDNYVYTKVDAAEFTIRTPTAVRPEEDETVGLALDDSTLHIFDASSGENLV